MNRYFAKKTPVVLLTTIAGLLGLAVLLAVAGWQTSLPWLAVLCWGPALALGWVGLGLIHRAYSWRGVRIDGASLVVDRSFGKNWRFDLPGAITMVAGDAASQRLVLGLNNGKESWRLILPAFREPRDLLDVLDRLVPVRRQRGNGKQTRSRLSEVNTSSADRFLVGLGSP